MAQLPDGNRPRHVLVDVADVAVLAGLHWGLECLGLVLGDVTRRELTAGCRQGVGGRVLVRHADGGTGSNRRGHGHEHEVRDRDGVATR